MHQKEGNFQNKPIKELAKMGSNRNCSDKFISAVKNNLPKPQDSGPKTEEAKRKVRYNALRHGLNISTGLLPCKSSCYYKSMCHLHRDIFKDNDYYIGECLLERREYYEYRSSLETMVDDPDLLEEMIWLYILSDRIKRFIALNPEISTENNELAKAYELHLRVQTKLIKIIRYVYY